MPRYDRRQPLAPRPGFTLIEVIVALSILSITGLVLASLFRAGIISYEYSLKLTTAVTTSRALLMGSPRREGLLWSTMSAEGVPAQDPAVEGADSLERQCFTTNEHRRIVDIPCKDNPRFVTYLLRVKSVKDKQIVIYSGATLRNRS